MLSSKSTLGMILRNTSQNMSVFSKPLALARFADEKDSQSFPGATSTQKKEVDSNLKL